MPQRLSAQAALLFRLRRGAVIHLTLVDRCRQGPRRRGLGNRRQGVDGSAGGSAFRVLLGIDQLHQAVHAGLDSAIEIALAELRRDPLADDPSGLDVGDGPFQAVADLDAQGAVVLRHQQQDAVVDLLLAQLPFLEGTHRVLLDGIVAGGRDQQHRELRAALGFQGGELLLQVLALVAGKGRGEVGDPRRQRGYRWHIGPGDQAGEQQPGAQ